MSSINVSSMYQVSNFSGPDEEAEFLLGPTRDPLTTVIPMTMVYSLILITGLIGNICTCFVIARNKYMHTTVNYYLFSLAVSDLLLLILGLPQELWALWQKYPYVFGETVCIFRALTSETSTNASVLTITAFTVERYFAICHPLRAHTMSQLPRAVKAILFIWLIAALSSIPIAFQLGIIYQISSVTKKPLPQTGQCAVKHPLKYSFDISTGAFFVLPMALILTLYFLIGLQLRKSSKSMERNRSTTFTKVSANSDTIAVPTTVPTNQQQQQQQQFLGLEQTATESANPRRGSRSTFGSSSTNGMVQHRQNAASRRAVIKMLVAVVVAFFICWAPFHAQRLMAIHAIDPPTSAEVIVFNLLTHISGITYYVSATINPILYSIMSLKFRSAFKDTLGHCFVTPRTGRQGQGQRGHLHHHHEESRTRMTELDTIAGTITGTAMNTHIDTTTATTRVGCSF